MQFNFATGTELSRTLASTAGTFDLYPYGLANIVPSDNLVVNGYAVLYLQDIWGNCLVELKHNGGVSSSPADWDFEVVAGVFGHGNPIPSRSSGIGAAAENVWRLRLHCYKEPRSIYKIQPSNKRSIIFVGGIWRFV